MDEQEFERAVRRLQTRMYRAAVSILWNDEDAADAIQETILRAWQKRRSLRTPEAFDVWLMRILLNEWKPICQGVFIHFLIVSLKWAITPWSARPWL